jgi:E-phenylitaconyl-CoA hydratase
VTICFETHEHVAILKLNRPEAMNAIDPASRAELKQAWKRVAADDSIRVVILTGAGDKAFCTGSDLKKTMPPAQSFAELTFGSDESDHLLTGMDTDKPIICAINGYAIGGGLELALGCDIRICAQHAQFGLSEVRLGSIPGAGGTQRLPRIIGASNAMSMLLTGDRIDAAEALRVGLVSQVVSGDQLMAAAMTLAQRIAANAPLAVRAVKRLVCDGLDMPLEQATRHERYVFGLLRDTDDRIEGRRAFQEKRAPQFQGR